MERVTAAAGHLFVYGTLCSGAGGPMHGRWMRGVRLAGRASIAARLYDAGPYPAAVPSDDPGDRVFGELYAIEADADGLFAALDEYQGTDAAHPALSLFRRETVAAEREDGMRVLAWVYFYNRPTDSLPRVTSGDWLGREPGA